LPPSPSSPLFPYTTLFRSCLASPSPRQFPARNRPWTSHSMLTPSAEPADGDQLLGGGNAVRSHEQIEPEHGEQDGRVEPPQQQQDRKSTRLNSSHRTISYA